MAVTDSAAAGAASTTDGAANKDGKPAAGTQPAADGKPAGTTGTETADTGKEPASKDAAASQQAKAPEKYALKFPEGGHVDASDLTAIEQLARAQDWTNDEAQAFVNQRDADVKKAATQFQEETKADPVYGGAHFDETQTHVTRALDKLRPAGTPRGDAFRALLNKSGYGNHLEVVSLLADLGKQMAEDSPVGGIAGGGGDSKDAASSLYGTGPQVKS
jgi:hypothetical protein